MSAVITQFPEQLHRMTVEQYDGLIRSGVFKPEDRLELLEGFLVKQISKDEPHVVAEECLTREMLPMIPNGYSYRSQNPIQLGDGEPEPDGAVVRGDVRSFLRQNRKPTAEDTLLVIEVADSSLRLDQTVKLRSYARAQIPAYWIVNLINRTIECYTFPNAAAVPDPDYRNRIIYTESDAIDVVIEGKTIGQVRVADILP